MFTKCGKPAAISSGTCGNLSCRSCYPSTINPAWDDAGHKALTTILHVICAKCEHDKCDEIVAALDELTRENAELRSDLEAHQTQSQMREASKAQSEAWLAEARHRLAHQPQPSQWVTVAPTNPPALHMVALYRDGCGASVLTKFDQQPYMQAEDGFEMSDQEVTAAFSMWAPAPEGFVPHFMEVTEDDWK